MPLGAEAKSIRKFALDHVEDNNLYSNQPGGKEGMGAHLLATLRVSHKNQELAKRHPELLAVYNKSKTAFPQRLQSAFNNLNRAAMKDPLYVDKAPFFKAPTKRGTTAPTSNNNTAPVLVPPPTPSNNNMAASAVVPPPTPGAPTTTLIPSTPASSTPEWKTAINSVAKLAVDAAEERLQMQRDLAAAAQKAEEDRNEREEREAKAIEEREKDRKERDAEREKDRKEAAEEREKDRKLALERDAKAAQMVPSTPAAAPSTPSPAEWQSAMQSTIEGVAGLVGSVAKMSVEAAEERQQLRQATTVATKTATTAIQESKESKKIALSAIKMVKESKEFTVVHCESVRKEMIDRMKQYEDNKAKRQLFAVENRDVAEKDEDHTDDFNNKVNMLPKNEEDDDSSEEEREKREAKKDDASTTSDETYDAASSVVDEDEKEDDDTLSNNEDVVSESDNELEAENATATFEIEVEQPDTPSKNDVADDLEVPTVENLEVENELKDHPSVESGTPSKNDDSSYSDSDSDEEYRQTLEQVPKWAQKTNLQRALERQFADGNLDPDKIFGECLTCKLEEIFDKKKSRYQRRTSSGNWSKDHITLSEKSDTPSKSVVVVPPTKAVSPEKSPKKKSLLKTDIDVAAVAAAVVIVAAVVAGIAFISSNEPSPGKFSLFMFGVAIFLMLIGSLAC